MYTIAFRPEVYHDIKTAYDWYETQRKGLGEDFMLTLDESFSMIARDPELYQKIYHSIRRKLVRRFPYGIFFMMQEDLIVVLAVLHTKSEPKKWEERA